MSDYTWTEIAAGAAVIAAAAGFFAYAAGVAGSGPAGGSYELTASFRSVEGIAVGSEVRMAGVAVGRVTGIDLDAETFRAETRFTVAEAYEIPDDSAVAIASEGLLGGSFVEILPGGSPFALDPGGEITDTQGAVSLLTLLTRFVLGSEEGG